ncbi:MAG: 4Fe-4S binding protein [Methanotrichaceae archaeon]
MTRCEVSMVVEPGSTLVTKTGAWRTFVPVHDHDKCIKCSLCEIFCPESCIHQVEGNFVPDLDYCKGCSVCAHECPRGAIEMVLEDK